MNYAVKISFTYRHTDRCIVRGMQGCNTKIAKTVDDAGIEKLAVENVVRELISGLQYDAQSLHNPDEE